MSMQFLARCLALGWWVCVLGLLPEPSRAAAFPDFNGVDWQIEHGRPVSADEFESLREAAAGQSLSLRTNDGLEHALQILRVNQIDGVVAIHAGTASGGEVSAVLAVGEEGALSGRLAGSEGVYLLAGHAGGNASLRFERESPGQPGLSSAANSSAMKSAALEPSAPGATTQGPSQGVQSGALASSVAQIDILAFFSEEFAVQYGGDEAAKAEIVQRIEWTNAALANSLVEVEFRIIGALKHQLGELLDIGKVVTDAPTRLSRGLTPGQLREVARIHATREAQGADIVGLFQAAGGANGSCHSFVATDPALDSWRTSKPFRKIFYGRTKGFFVDSCGGQTSAHALGHVLGQADDVHALGGPEPLHTYGYGSYGSGPAGGFYTIMAASDVATQGREAVPYYSTPLVRGCKGAPCGKDGETDNARSMRFTAPYVADWMPANGFGRRLASADVGGHQLQVRLASPLVDARYQAIPMITVEQYLMSLPADPTPEDPFDKWRNFPNDMGSAERIHKIPANHSAHPKRYRIVVQAGAPVGFEAPVSAFVFEDRLGTRPVGVLCWENRRHPIARCQVDVEQPPGAPARTIFSYAHSSESDLHASGYATATFEYLMYFAPLDDPASREYAVTGPITWPDITRPAPIRFSWSAEPLPFRGSFSGHLRGALVAVRSSPGSEPDYYEEIIEHPTTRYVWQPSRALLPGQELQVPVLHLDRVANRFTTAHLEVSPSMTRVEFSATVNAHQPHIAASSIDRLEVFAVPPAQGTLDAGGHGEPFVDEVDDSRWASALPLARVGEFGFKLVVDGQALVPGRWRLAYRTKAWLETVSLALRADVEGDSSQVQAGHYYNPARSGHGLNLDWAHGQWVGVWYTYLEDGSPTWYYLQVPAPGDGQPMSGTLYRYGWNGAASDGGTAVGSFVITPNSGGAIAFAYNLEGKSGSERMVRLGGPGCPIVGGQLLDASGHWFSPQRPGFGYSSQFDADTRQEIYTVYLYDEAGLPRWLVAQGAIGADEHQLALQQATGSCPTCEYRGPQTRTVGTLRRSMGASWPDGRWGLSRLAIDAQFAPPLAGQWRTDLPAALLSTRMQCR